MDVKVSESSKRKPTQLLEHKAPIRCVPVEYLHKPIIKVILETMRNAHRDIFTMENVFMDEDARDSPMAALDNEDVQKRYKRFKKFDTLADHSGHLFSMRNSPMSQPKKRWANDIQKEWKILKKNLPDTIFVRVYESRMDLLTAAIIGPKGTPYHDGLFFFDLLFPRSYPKSPPLLGYHSGGLAINPNLQKNGIVQLTLPKTTDSGQVEEGEMWVPGTSNILNLLISIQNQILITKPFYNYMVYAKESLVDIQHCSLRSLDEQGISILSVDKQHSSLLYNENTFLKSLKTMVYIMNKPPKVDNLFASTLVYIHTYIRRCYMQNFENLVVGHFRNRVRDILMACKAYTEGVQVGCLGVQGEAESGENETSTLEFRNDVASCMKLLVAAFMKIGAKEAEEFLPLIKKNAHSLLIHQHRYIH